MADRGSYPAFRLLMLVLAAVAIAIPLGWALPAADGLEYSVPSPSITSQDFYHTPLPDFPYASTSSPVALSLASSPVPYPSLIQKTFFTRAMAPFERLLKSCFFEDVSSVGDCLKEKVILALRRASGMDSVPLGGRVALVKEEHSDVRGGAEEEGRNDTGGSLEDVDSRLIKGFAEFLRGRALRVSLPESIIPLVQDSLEEARGKKHKHLGTLLTCVAVILKTLAIASIAFIAKKALLVGKLALLLSAALLAKKLMGGGGGGGGGSASGTSYEVVSLHRRSHQRDLLRHGETYGYGPGEMSPDRDGTDWGDSLAYGGYALVRRGKRVLDADGEIVPENLSERS